jgi:hypothetical protein
MEARYLYAKAVNNPCMACLMKHRLNGMGKRWDNLDDLRDLDADSTAQYAIEAMHRFLNRDRFCVRQFTASQWAELLHMGKSMEAMLYAQHPCSCNTLPHLKVRPKRADVAPN